MGFSTGFTCYFVYTVFSNSDVGFCLFGLMIFCVVLAVLNAIFMFVFLNRLVGYCSYFWAVVCECGPDFIFSHFG